MAHHRVVMHLTGRFGKKSKKESTKAVRRYLQRYADEKGKEKANLKRGLDPKAERGTLLPKTKSTSNAKDNKFGLGEGQGKIYSGGFLQEDPSPGASKPRMQEAWIKRKVSTWMDLITPQTKRTSDGHRIVLSLAPLETKELTKCGISGEEALKDIWETTLELYKEKHGWEQEELAWVGGTHHDTNNLHLHILLFPTTKSGIALRTSNQRKGEDRKIDDLDEFRAMANQAAELYWRKTLPLEYQTPEYQIAQILDETLPELPSLEDFWSENPLGKNKVITKDPKRDEEIAKAKERNVTRLEKAEELARLQGNKDLIEFFTTHTSILPESKEDQKKHLQNLRRAKHQLKDLDRAISGWIKTKGEKDLPSLTVILTRDNAEEQARLKAILNEIYPESEASLDDLEDLIKEVGDENLARVLPPQRNTALLEMILGSAPYVPRGSEEEAVLFQKEYQFQKKKSNPDAIDKSANNFQKTLSQLRERWLLLGARRIQTKRIKDQKAQEKTQKFLERLHRGSKIIMNALESRLKDLRAMVSKVKGENKFKERDLEWEIVSEGGIDKIVIGDTKGAPWPQYLNPQDILQKIDPKIEITQTPEELFQELEKMDRESGKVETTKDSSPKWEDIGKKGILAQLMANKNKRKGGMK